MKLHFITWLGVVYADVATEFNVLSYNVAGLGLGLSSAEADRTEATQIISCYVNQFDVVNVQEDFDYHAALYDTCNNHEYRTPTSGGMAFGSGLNTMSHYPLDPTDRVTWNDRNGVDGLTPKGFTKSTVRLAEGAYVDIYNLHAQAANTETDQDFRRRNLIQLADYIKEHSADNAVLVFGDVNARHTRAADNVREYITGTTIFEADKIFEDTWVEITRSGSIPPVGDAITCDPHVTSPNCEIVDKILYRSNAYVNLQATSFDFRDDALMPDGVTILSDHPPIESNFDLTSPANFHQTDFFGGTGGTSFSHANRLIEDGLELSTISVAGGSRLDQIQATFSDGTVITNGGDGGGTPETLTLGNGEYFNSATLCQGERNGGQRIFSASFSTNQGRTVSDGGSTNDCQTWNLPSGWKINGFHGKVGSEVDRLGLIWKQL